MSHLLCNEFLKCEMTDCPSYDNRENDKCWTVENTLCLGRDGTRRCKTIAEKSAQCYGSCEYHLTRTIAAFR